MFVLLFQDEKNEFLHTNMWLNYVSDFRCALRNRVTKAFNGCPQLIRGIIGSGAAKKSTVDICSFFVVVVVVVVD